MKVIEQKIRSLYHSTVFLWLVSEFLLIFSFGRVCLWRHYVCFSPASRPRTQILSLFILAAIILSTLHGQISHVISAVCQGLRSCHRHIGKREDPWDEVDYNHVTLTLIAKNFMLYCRLIYILSMLYVRLMIKLKVGIQDSFNVGWYPHKITGLSHLKLKIYKLVKKIG